MADFIEDTLTTIQNIRNAETPGTYIKQRLSLNADQLSRTARIQGAIEAANEALCKLTSILYETVERVPVNVDSRTYRILIPVPWGDSGYHIWGMHAVEARILRAVLMERTGKQDALFDYAERRWFLNAAVYKNVRVALEYLHANPITAREWFRHANAWHDSENKRNKRRQERKSTR